ncbi:hypothetical protein PC9H_006745 [Pleurotus ostreatus]|uniref:Fungal lipase-type domain-containing protein n=1 Tax=Pleurotus ostreatus TaxID=5322 RepID=A0A8H7DUD5_PLEOS|nr:uncharacterized protein PC9H_006745 [Pleurotus ostreatus]KAF7431029.1 hypothetical protein PC9H_006745 [Pleurotus ostreatus]
MTSLYLLSWFTFVVAVACSTPADTNSTVLQKRAISQQVFDDLVFYFQYASSAYNDVCAQPNGNTLVQRIDQLLTDTQGFIVRDDGRKEIVVALRGSTSPTDFLLDNELFLVPFITPGVSPPLGSLVHTGFVTAWNSIALQVISIVRAQLNAHPGYSLVTTGHSLGGSLSSLAAISLKQNFPKVMYTYGQPRTFNPISAQFINSQFGANAFRSVHTIDGAASSISTVLGYRHHGVEYWQNPDPATPVNVKQCSTTNGEDPTCSASIPFLGIGSSHLTYYGIAAGIAFCTSEP